MGLFSYKAVDKSGKIVKGNIDENSLKDAAAHLRKLGLTPFEIKKLNIWNTDIADLPINKKVNAGELAVFCSQLSFALGAGVSLNQALETLYRNDLSVSPKLRKASLEISELIQKGESLSVSLKKMEIFPGFLVAMAEVGERSGSLPLVMDRLAKYYELEHKISSEIINALIYPTIVSIFMTCVIILALVFVLPRYMDLFAARGVDLPSATLMLIEVSKFLTKNYILIIAFLSALTIGVYFALRTALGNTFRSWLKLNFPLLSGVYKKALNSRFTQALFIMTESGLEITSALEVSYGVLNNKIMETALNKITNEMRSGESLSASISRIRYFDRMLPAMLSVAEESGTLPDMLNECAVHLQKETETKLSRFNKLMEPIILLTMGGLLMFVMLAIILPTFQLTEMT